ncbi:hypothetical protein P692DRAFT_20821271 [Suillus brevipes Sb2]|nr:hypothetical protein P692DRAFT_20821271 [Suillus brevipes Sb2]
MEGNTVKCGYWLVSVHQLPVKFTEIPTPLNIMMDCHFLVLSSIFAGAAVIQSKQHDNNTCNTQCVKHGDMSDMKQAAVHQAAMTLTKIPVLLNIMPDHHYCVFSAIFAGAAWYEVGGGAPGADDIRRNSHALKQHAGLPLLCVFQHSPVQQ